MNFSIITESLWGKKAKFSYLFLASFLLVFTFLGDRQIWTQEHRWADIVFGMFYRHDFLHPYLGNSDYYDKPLLSYWLIALFAKLNHGLTTWSLRLPSALAGLLSIWSIYRIGCLLKNKELGLLAGWLLLTTYYFVFWSRTSSADMLNLAGSLFAMVWYLQKRNHPHFFNYAVFFMIIALTSLCKGLVGAVVPFMAVIMDITLHKSWKQHFRLSLFLALVPALCVYFSPFLASHYIGGETFGQNGLYLVYRENILRYFKPFDHQGPIYTYLIYLPIYSLPSALLFIPALLSLKSRWKSLPLYAKWIVLVLFSLFVFFSLSGSRRSYYVLPIVPFAILLTADWILAESKRFAKKQLWTTCLILFSFIFLYFILDIIPAWYETKFGVSRFANALKYEVEKKKDWKEWNIVMLDAESKLNFYLQLPPDIIRYRVKRGERVPLPTKRQLLTWWPVLKNRPNNTIFISRKLYAPALKRILVNYAMFQITYTTIPLVRNDSVDVPVAFIPI